MVKTVRTILAIMGLLLFALPAPCRASEPPLPLKQYWQHLQELQSLIIELQDLPVEASRSQLQAETDRWQTVTAVVLPDGTVVPTDHGFLVAQLRADPPDLAQLERLLDALLAVQGSWPQQERTPQDIAALQRVLARPEFQWEPEQPSALAKWWQRLLERLDRLLSRFGLGVGRSPLLRYLLTGLGAVALAAVLFYALRNIWGNLVVESDLAQAGRDDDLDLTSVAALERAHELARGKDFRSAVRYLYLSSLLLLEERGLLRYDRSLTNREYLRSLERHPQLRFILQEVVGVFERVWYGFQLLDEASFARYADRIEDLQRLR